MGSLKDSQCKNAATQDKARNKCDSARNDLDDGVDPGVTRRLKRISDQHEGADTLKAIATEWFETKMGEKSDSYRVRTQRLLKNDLYPPLGTRPINQIEPPELLMARPSSRRH